MEDMSQQVCEFNRRVLGIARRPVGTMMSEAEAQLLAKQLREEVDEFDSAFLDGDVVGCVDALLDGIYFALGGMWRMGMTPSMSQQLFTLIHTANLEKKLGVVERRGDGSAPDAVKPEGWTPPEDRIKAAITRWQKEEKVDVGV